MVRRREREMIKTLVRKRKKVVVGLGREELGKGRKKARIKEIFSHLECWPWFWGL